MPQYQIAFAGTKEVTVETADTLEELVTKLHDSGYVVAKLINLAGRASSGVRDIAVFRDQVLTISKLRD